MASMLRQENRCYLLFPCRSRARIRGETVDQGKLTQVGAVARTHAQASLGLPDGTAPSTSKQAGWAVVFHKDEDVAVKKEVMRLYEHRRQQIKDDLRVKVLEYAGEAGWREWLAKYRVGAGNVNPFRVPYYLLLVGGPQRIPFDFCQMLSLEYAVGLLHFDDAAAYGRYVDSVIAYEAGKAPPGAKEAVFFRTSGDRATDLSAAHLVAPLAEAFPPKLANPLSPQ